jgi:hypothetical protein
MIRSEAPRDWWTLNLEGMPQFDMAIQRVYAWYRSELIDRPPVRFLKHNIFIPLSPDSCIMSFPNRGFRQPYPEDGGNPDVIR